MFDQEKVLTALLIAALATLIITGIVAIFVLFKVAFLVI